MRWALLLFLVGCGAEDRGGRPVPGDSGVSSTPSGAPSTPGVPTLTSPAEAEDLDPDPGVLEVQLTAAPHRFEVLGGEVDGYAYNGQVPGPTLRARVGDTLVVELVNELSDPTTIHWHGLHVPWEMDGITWMQDPVGPGERFTYRFTLEQAGTFWYHPHFDTARQVDLGLYGVLVVEDPSEPAVDLDEVWVFDAWGEQDWADRHTEAPDPTARTWTVNGLEGPVWRPPGGAVARIRLLNASNAGYLSLSDLRVIAHDQGLLEAVQEGGLLLGPGDRAELEWAVDGPRALEAAPYAAAGGPAFGDPIPLLSVEPAGGTGPAPPVTWPTGGNGPSPDPGGTAVRWSFQGDAQGPWTINGEVFPDVTLPQIPVGQPAVIEIRNLSAAEHPFHLHGMTFEVLSVDGQPPAYRTVEDTWNVRIGEVVRLGVDPPREGDWMAHCHILPHAEAGMMTVLQVTP